ncbi:xyloglucan galactosyltransferase MUR3 [Marchantia polymorpha subsp. ruderalis]
MHAADTGGVLGSCRRTTSRASHEFACRLDESEAGTIERFHRAMKKGSKMPSPKLYLWICLLAIALIILICTGFDSVDTGYLSLESLKPALIVSYAINSKEVEDADSVCRGRRVYMYELPSKFNVDFYLNKTMCREGLMAWLDLCGRFEHGGYGLRYLNRTQYEGQWDEHWYDTDSYMLEVIFHTRMQSYPCRTLDPSRADAFFIPYYTGVDALLMLYEKPDLSDTIDKRANFGSEIVEWMDKNAHQYWHKYQGRDHFMLWGRTCWDFRLQKYWGTGFVDRQYIFNTTNLMMEREPTTENEQAIPYPTGFHPSSPERLWSWILEVQRSERNFLMAYVGAPRPELDWSVRGILSTQCAKAGNKTCNMVDCHEITCSHNPLAIYKAFLKSNFCLQPRGDSSTRRSTFDCMIAGSIPVFFHPDSAYTQYTWHLPQDPTSYSVYISEDDLKAGVTISKVLRGYSQERIHKMRKTIISIIPNLIYNDYSNDIRSASKDAFELSIEKVVERITDYKKSVKSSA